MSWWWLSFQEDRGRGAVRGLGSVIVQGETLETAEAEARALRIHPGGQATGFEIPGDKAEIPATWRNKLLNEANAKALVTWTNRAWGTR